MSKRNNSGGIVKNRAPAPIQISAEQIVREAADRQIELQPEPIIKVHDQEEYQQHLADRRKLYEDNIRYRREHIGNYVKYAKFEEDNNEYVRARSIYERALEVDYRSSELWLRYAEFELRNEFLNHARNVLDRAVQILPRVNFLWYKYVFTEELAGDISKCRAVFNRWLEWQPDDNVYISYAKFEIRCKQYNNAELIMKKYCQTYPYIKSFIKYAKFAEYELHDIVLARTIYEAALQELDSDEILYNGAKLFQQFGLFEERQKEYERARIIYQHAIQLLKLGKDDTNKKTEDDDDDDDDNEITKQEKQKRKQLYEQYIIFEKKHGDKASIERAVIQEQRDKYEQQIKDNPYDYDNWFELIKLEEDNNEDPNKVRDVYERAVANIPLNTTNKVYWKRYIYLWIYYSIYEEIQQNDIKRAIQVYETCLKIIPHKQFSFSKIWIYLAKCYIRNKDIKSARKIFGRALGICGKEKIYIEYINIELSLGEIDRCRTLYNNYLKVMPYNGTAWCKYAQLEHSIGEIERGRSIYELAIKQDTLNQPELVWKSYIDFEINENEAEHVRKLYNRLLEKTGHVKVWISYAQFESTTIGKGIDESRKVFETAYNQLKQSTPDGSKEERVLLLDAWRVLEKSHGDEQSISNVEAKLPRRIKRKRVQYDDNGNDIGWEEYFDYQFPDDIDTDAAAANKFKILEMAAKWKEEQQQKNKKKKDNDDSDDSSSSSSDDD